MLFFFLMFKNLTQRNQNPNQVSLIRFENEYFQFGTTFKKKYCGKKAFKKYLNTYFNW